MEQVAQEFSHHHRQKGDQDLFEHDGKRAVDAEPRESQPVKNREDAEGNFEECLRLRRQRGSAGEPNDAPDKNADCVQDCARHAQNQSRRVARGKRKAGGLSTE